MTRLIAIVFLILLGIILYQGVVIKDLDKKLSKSEDYKALYEVSNQKNIIYQDELNKWRNKVIVGKVSSATLKEESKKGNPEVKHIRETFPEVKKNFKNLESYSKIETSSTSKFTADIVDKVTSDTISDDTITQKVIEYSNEFSSYAITITPDLKSASVKREGREEFEGVIYFQRLTKKGRKTIWPFGSIVYSNEMRSNNPETKIVKLTSISIKRK